MSSIIFFIIILVTGKGMRRCWFVAASELASALAAFRLFASSDRTMLSWAMGFYMSDSLFRTIPLCFPVHFTSASHALQIRSSCVFFTHSAELPSLSEMDIGRFRK